MPNKHQKQNPSIFILKSQTDPDFDVLNIYIYIAAKRNTSVYAFAVMSRSFKIITLQHSPSH